jgi:proteasome accessory factor B
VGVVRYSGRWYAVGLDTDRGQERIFRLSRVQGRARRHGRPGSYDVPPGTDLRAIARRLAPPPTTERAVVLVRAGAGWALRRSAESVETGVPGPDEQTPWDRVSLSRTGPGLADELLGYGADLLVEEPADLRAQVVARLSAVVGGERP